MKRERITSHAKACLKEKRRRLGAESGRRKKENCNGTDESSEWRFWKNKSEKMPDLQFSSMCLMIHVNSSSTSAVPYECILRTKLAKIKTGRTNTRRTRSCRTKSAINPQLMVYSIKTTIFHEVFAGICTTIDKQRSVPS